MKSNFSHDNWVSAFNRSELSAFDIIKLAKEQCGEFIWHPLGFILCKLSEEGERKIRLHIWPNNNDRMQKPAWLIHDHMFDLKSWVITGKIENTEYSVTEGKSNYRVYNAKYEKDSSVLYRTDRLIRLYKNNRSLLNAGEAYEVPLGILHQSVSSSESTTVTVCETINRPSISPIIAGEINGAVRYSYTRAQVDENDLHAIIAKI